MVRTVDQRDKIIANHSLADLDWPLNASRGLSAIAEFLVILYGDVVWAGLVKLSFFLQKNIVLGF